MLNVYLDPFSTESLLNRLFSADPELDRDAGQVVWRYLREYCIKNDINLNTVDIWDKERATDSDVYVALNHKERPILKEMYRTLIGRLNQTPNLSVFGRRILFQFETPVVQPWPYSNMKNLAKIYDTMFFSCKIPETEKYGYVHYPQPFNMIFPKYWKNKDRLFLTMINANKRLFLPPTELHTERIKAVAFFGKFNEIDLYGHGWNNPVRSTDLNWSVVRHVYKGSVASKNETMYRYTFAICFENMALPGYITEKIIDCFLVGTVPVYLGAQDIEKYIPKRCFIDMRDFENFDELRTHLKTMTRKEIETYRNNAKRYLESKQYFQFTKEYFAELFVDLVNGVPRKS